MIPFTSNHKNSPSRLFSILSALLFLSLSVLSFNQVHAEAGLMKPISLAQRINNSDLVIEGKVIHQESYWDQSKRKIYTLNQVEVYKVFKGYSGSNTYILTEGGTVGLERLEVHPSLELAIGEIGIFTLKNKAIVLQNNAQHNNKINLNTVQGNFMAPVASAQGFIKYDAVSKKAIGVFNEYQSVSSYLYTAISSITGQGHSNVKTFDVNGYLHPTNVSLTGGKRLTPIITSITNIATNNNVATAGTYTEIEISGTGFLNAEGILRFPNADDGGATSFDCHSDLILSWTDTKINVLVPSGSATGSLQVEDTSGLTTTGTVIIPYNVNNLKASSTYYVSDMINHNAAGGYTWTFNNNFVSNSDALSRFDEALCAWTSATGVHWDTTMQNTTSIACEGNDGVNVVTFDDACNLPSGVFATCYSYYSACNSGGFYWYVSEMDIKFSNTGATNWYFGSNPSGIGGPQYDFMSIALHELGHGAQLGHFSLSSDVMYWSISNGATNRVVDANSSIAGLFVMDRNGTGPGDLNWDAEVNHIGHNSGGSFTANACGPSRMLPYTCAPGPTCFDGILNQDETAIDCGGVCQTCAEKCSNGIQDGGETGVDCGGPCFACCVSYPANDSLCNAQQATFIANSVCLSGQTNTCANPSVLATGCVGATDRVVWYEFVQPSGTNQTNISFTNTTFGSIVNLMLYESGGTCIPTTVQTQCGFNTDTFSFNAVDSLTYYLGIATPSLNAGGFDICISAGVGSPSCNPSYLTNNITLCNGDSAFVGGSYYFTSDTIIDTIPHMSSSCDSIITTYNISLDSVCLPNDNCSDAILLSCGDTLMGSTIGATTDPFYTCTFGWGHRQGVWYTVTGTGGYVTLSTCSMADFDTKIDIYVGNCSGMSCVAGNDDYTACIDYTSQVSFPSDSGTEYYVFVHGYGSAEGDFSITYDCNPNYVTGHIYNDVNGNCVRDSGDYALNNSRLIQIQPGNRYAYANADGNYAIYLEDGTYAISLVDNDEDRSIICPANNIDSIHVGTSDSLVVDFALQPLQNCSEIELNIGTWALRPCTTNYYCVQYWNIGTATSANTAITIELQEGLSIASTNGTITSINADSSVYIFNVGDVDPNASGYFFMYIYQECDLTQVGLTKCVKASVIPDNSCSYTVDVDSTWDKSSVSVEGACSQDSLACFTITNTGDFGNGDMDGPSEYRIYENDTLVIIGTFQLTGQETIEICHPARNNTIRLEADQRFGHPGFSRPRESIEACGQPDPDYEIGLITSTPEDDLDGFVDIDCHEITTSYDPNDKLARPTGVTDEYHYIDSLTILEYTVRFQNTGTDTAFKVIVRDTIDSDLDLQSYDYSFSTHSHTTDFLEGNVIQWTFENILLPDSGRDQVASNGLIRFKISQKSGNVDGTVINNNADIFFDYNPPVRTNTTYHTIGEVTYFEIQGISTELKNDLISIYPNPASDFFNVDLKDKSSTYALRITSVTGALVKEVTLDQPTNQVDVSTFNRGLYFIEVTNQKDPSQRQMYKLQVF